MAFTSGVLAKAISITIMYPFTTVKVRL
ncbi:MAG: MC/SLC25 family protein [bacterium]